MFGPFAGGETDQAKTAFVGSQQRGAQRSFVVGVADVGHRSFLPGIRIVPQSGRRMPFVLRTNSELVGELNQKSRRREHQRDADSTQEADATREKAKRLLQDFVAASGSSLGLDAIERVGGGVLRW